MAFHPYPQLIRALFNVNRFGPPGPVTDPSAWPRVDHRVSRLSPATGRPVQTRSRSGSAPEGLSLAAEEQLVGSLCKRHAVALSCSDRLQTDGFRFCFTPLPGVLPTFPSRYWSTVGLPVVFSLAGWSPLFRTGFLVSRPTQVAAPRLQVAPTGVSPSSPGVSTPFGFPEGGPWPLLLPRACLDTHGLGSSLFARRYSGNRFFLSSPPGTEMFQFPGFAPAYAGDGPSARRVAPFGNARISSCLQIPAPFRSLPRPSSPPEA